MALAALGAGLVLDVGATTAEAAPSVSPFAGTYVGADPQGWYPSWSVTISNKGQISGSFGSSGQYWKGTIGGGVSAGGRYSFTVSVTEPSYDEGPRDPRVPRSKRSYESAGNLTSDPAGDILGTDDTGRSFIWLRQ
jgi:hypothetical protein